MRPRERCLQHVEPKLTFRKFSQLRLRLSKTQPGFVLPGSRSGFFRNGTPKEKKFDPAQPGKVRDASNTAGRASRVRIASVARRVPRRREKTLGVRVVEVTASLRARFALQSSVRSCGRKDAKKETSRRFVDRAWPAAPEMACAESTAASKKKVGRTEVQNAALAGSTRVETPAAAPRFVWEVLAEHGCARTALAFL
mmetsp:Transcript_22344/g.41961  ORF Transcript_22344/g.41961 Transcript_22344/m.41961 type:complete len:197 (+) Transcript_22344:1573-2163(+)